MKFTGKAIIRINGSEIRSTDNATLSVGGENRTAIKGGGRVYGYNEETQEPTLECNVAHCSDTDLVSLSAIVDATIIFETDSGAKFVLQEAFVTEPASLNVTDGTASMKFSACRCETM